MIRPPAVAGMFYEIDPERLKKQIKGCFTRGLGKEKIQEQSFKACVAPHAGYLYSGPIAAHVYSRIKKANYIILGSNHHPIGNKYAMGSGEWKTPLGGVKVNKKVAEQLMKCPLLKNDPISHQPEHSIEVQLPFLQYRFGNDFSFVPIAISNDYPSRDFLEECRILGEAIADVIKKQKDDWIVIASSDFSHYVPYEYAYQIDKWVIESIVGLDEEEFFSRVQERDVSVCGFGGIAVCMVAAKKLGSKKGELLKYATSGDVIGDKNSVVGYGSIIIK
ncbi:MAG: AmmeMemoRadiSam system protein B [Candidatus Aenigmarchaeota archaeon CG1_02_38_14]|nr:MEMO1 family protein [Candidatus Aenigmarchaeota archaeon]OIN88661.1 MAG: AmmeMemoRadiSam system protein B [Candidatus Aenigmarchaeota archaeon CG1_02_38_14]